MFFSLSLISIIIAGLVNGSFVIPSRFTKGLSTEKIWFYYSIVGLIIIPWLVIVLFFPNILSNYLLLPHHIWFYILLGGIIFGLGQVCFAYAIQYIGIALSFSINLGLGALLGSMFVVFYRHLFFTTAGLLVTVAVVLIVVSLASLYQANRQNHNSLTLFYGRGWCLGLLAGIASGFQNSVFITVLSLSTNYISSTYSFWMWPPFLTAAAVIMMIGMLFKLSQQQQTTSFDLFLPHLYWNLSLIVLMGLCFSGSLGLYSLSITNLSHKQQIIAWPVFMIAIIFTCQGWGWFNKEWQNQNKQQYNYRLLGLFLLIVAIILLALPTK